MIRKAKRTTCEIGYIGETWVLYKLAKWGVYGIRLPSEFDYDIITNGNQRIEVKSSTLRTYTVGRKGKSYTSKAWQFANTSVIVVKDKNNFRFVNKARRRKCDFFAFVCLDEQLSPIKTYIVPRNIVNDRKLIRIHVNNTVWYEYLESWSSFRRPCRVSKNVPKPK